MEIPASEFESLYYHFLRYPLAVNKYRTTAGKGMSQTFGVVNRRCLPPDYSRQNWLRPFTLHLLKDFADKWCPIPWNSVTINMNYKAAPHRDKHNVGQSFLVGFGDYQGGELEFHEGDLKGLHNIKHRGILHDFSKDLHSVKDFTGTRMSLVFYTYDLKGLELPPWSVKEEGGAFWFYRGDEKITKDKGLPHPLRGRKKT